MDNTRSELLQGTLDMLILKALQRDAMHGFGLSQRIREMSKEVFHVEMGSLYPALCRLEARGWIQGAWGLSDANRKARFYSLTAGGRRQLLEETAKWETLSGAINFMLRST
jgi:PadR family transcriptional regulator, regulatory protein PadR